MSRLLWLFLVVAGCAAGQGRITFIGSIGFGNVHQMVNGGIYTIWGEGLAPSTTAASRVPWPRELGGVTVVFQGRPQELLFVSPGQINFRAQATLGSMGVVSVRHSGMEIVDRFQRPIESAGFGVIAVGWDCAHGAGFVPSQLPPAVSPIAITCVVRPGANPVTGELRGAITDPSGRLISAQHPMRPGGTYTIWGSGLGSDRSVGVILEDLVAAESFFAGPSPEFPGLDQVNFRLPQVRVFCTTYQLDVRLRFRGGTFYAATVPVRIDPADVVGCP